MKTLGLLGGISWVSTIDYYRAINEGINARLGGLNFSRCIIHSFNYADIKKNNDAGDWDATLNLMVEAGEHLKSGGAAAILLCANTMHVIAEPLAAKLQIPVIHIAEVTATAVKQKGIKKVALLGTKFTMEMDFFKDKLKAEGIEPMIPDEADREYIHASIFGELARGIITAEMKAKYLAIIDKLAAAGAEGVILGCTEIPLLLKPNDIAIPSFDTTLIHAAAAVAFSLSD